MYLLQHVDVCYLNPAIEAWDLGVVRLSLVKFQLRTKNQLRVSAHVCLRSFMCPVRSALFCCHPRIEMNSRIFQ